MARKEARIVIDAEGRDKGKVFIIREMAAEPLEDWAIRVFIGLQRAGMELPEDMRSLGVAGMVRLGLQALAGMSMEELRPLLAEMMECIDYIPDNARPGTTIPTFRFPEQIEEVATRLYLRTEWFRLHVGFSTPGEHSTSTPTPGDAGQRHTTPNTSTSRAR